MEVETIRARACLLGTRIGPKRRGAADLPFSTSITDERVVVFRFGAIVAFGMSDEQVATYIASLLPMIEQPLDDPEIEDFEIRIDPESPEHITGDGAITIREASPERLRVVADALAKSIVLNLHEYRITPVMDRVALLAGDLKSGRKRARHSELTHEIGDALLAELQTVGRVEVTEKPEITWDNGELDKLYERLATELELAERDAALSRKFALASRTSELYLNLSLSRQGIRVEWYIVLLIVFEIVLIVYDLAMTN